MAVPFQKVSDGESGTAATAGTHIRIGNLEIDLDANGTGIVKVNGERVSCAGFRIEYDAMEGRSPCVTLRYYPVPNRPTAVMAAAIKPVDP